MVCNGRKLSAIDESQTSHRCFHSLLAITDQVMTQVLNMFVSELAAKVSVLIGQLLTRDLRGTMICRRMSQAVPDTRSY